jgi:hypothetical protein
LFFLLFLEVNRLKNFGVAALLFTAILTKGIDKIE